MIKTMVKAKEGKKLSKRLPEKHCQRAPRTPIPGGEPYWALIFYMHEFY
jgi:hypothetical protein